MSYNVFPPISAGAATYGAYISLAQNQLPADLRGNVIVGTSVNIPVGQYVVEQYGNATTSVVTTFGSRSISGTVLATSAIFFDNPATITRVFSTIPDNTIWATRTAASALTDIMTIVFGNGIYIHAGLGGQIGTSTNAITWTTRNSNTTNNFRASVYGNDLYVLVGDNGILMTSTDAIAWTTRSTGFGSSGINGVAYGNGIFVATGQMFPSGSDGAIVISTNGITWSTRVVNSAIATKSFNDVVFGNGIFVAGRNSTPAEVYTSTDGLNWTTRSVNFAGGQVQKLGFGNGVFLASNNTGPVEIRTSTDAITWTTRSFGMQSLRAFAGGNNRLYAFGDAPSFSDARVWTSTNGVSWVQYFVPPLESNHRTGYAVNGIVLAAGAQARLATTTRTGNPYVQATIFSEKKLTQQVVE